MISRRNLLIAGAAVPFLSYAHIPAFAATPKDILVVAQQLDNMTSLDPHEGFEAVGGEIMSNMYQKLVRANREDSTKVDPVIAKSWEADAESKVFTFVIGDDATFSSGAKVTAEDVAFSLQRAIKMNKSPAFIIGQFGFTPDNAETTIVAADEKTVKLTTAKPTAISFLLYCLSANIGAIVEKKAVLANASGEDLGNGWLQKNSAGSGDFMLQAWKPSESVALTVNPNGPYKGNIKRVILRHVTDPSSQLLMLQKGDIDIARDLTSEQLRTVQNDANIELQRKSIASLVLISLNQGNENLAKPQVWQAIKWALDYKGMQENIVPLTHKVHQSFEPEGFPGAVNDTPYQRDVEKAKALMAEAGLADGFEITMDHYSAQPYPDLAQAIQANLADIGIKVRLQSAENRQVLTKMRGREHQMALSAWGTDYFDPHSNADVFNINKDNGDDAKSKPFLWRSRFKNDDFAAKAEAARDEKDPAKRIELYEALQREHMENSPFVFMFQTTKTAAFRKGVSGFELGVLSEGNSYHDAKKA
ncbi:MULTISPECIES: ABC transporter substrate-binding protein [Rhizobium/Agrobacterium group]|jgi:peptide/nickel transport system substrate-binding protein|uniref:ABC transporter substrate-binding protein n=4 Tax=Rhizobium/Agrobacterium group TaxID=227290 RepID=A0AAJ4MZD3_AGRTU|nr:MULTISPECIES: ABC transporter substrate-binding protein [Rhizobium/Agrobacterium group]EHJ99019.1 dipeptide ABC transporter substrate-binding protein [Agrobacterium tumefaciens 5A]MCP2133764.1 peptide/nickel transport system substrate-binding protein [Rhizobium sp. SLBN-94]MDP9561199.1 peptide/nickel transport system substrate-binding protein [Rhizobium nepotum]QDG91494.1 ABC transporter substrate-binding protein [Rhizobium sp. NIBRBAC000502774]TGE80874.1 ABC transporter substrate-binding p